MTIHSYLRQVTNGSPGLPKINAAQRVLNAAESDAKLEEALKCMDVSSEDIAWVCEQHEDIAEDLTFSTAT